MKKLISLFLLLFIAGTVTAVAQNDCGNCKEKGPKISKEERVDNLTARLYVSLELNDDQMKAVKSTLTEFMTEMDDLREESGDKRPDPQTVLDIHKKRDAEFAEIFTEDQNAKYEEMKDNLYQRRKARRGHGGKHQKRG